VVVDVSGIVVDEDDVVDEEVVDEDVVGNVEEVEATVVVVVAITLLVTLNL